MPSFRLILLALCIAIRGVPGQAPSGYHVGASVTGTEPGVAHVVVLRVSWDYSCGSMCAMAFTHTRTVWFDARGTVVRILEDARPLVIVS
jgi:hypothetical protein